MVILSHLGLSDFGFVLQTQPRGETFSTERGFLPIRSSVSGIAFHANVHEAKYALLGFRKFGHVVNSPRQSFKIEDEIPLPHAAPRGFSSPDKNAKGCG